MPQLDRSEDDRPIQGAAAAVQLLALRKSAVRVGPEQFDAAGAAVPLRKGVSAGVAKDSRNNN
jgi:hypothetical protein